MEGRQASLWQCFPTTADVLRPERGPDGPRRSVWLSADAQGIRVESFCLREKEDPMAGPGLTGQERWTAACTVQ